jgi:hypothetical protein
MKNLVVEIEGLLPDNVEINLEKSLKITNDLDYEVDHAAYTFGYVAVLSEKAEDRYERLKFSFENWQAELEARLFKQREEEIKQSESKLKPYTENQMKALVRAEPKYKLYKQKLLKLDHDRKVLKVFADSLAKKKDLIQTKCSNRRNEEKR